MTIWEAATDHSGQVFMLWGTAFVLHVVYTFPFAFLVMLAIFNRFDQLPGDEKKHAKIALRGILMSYEQEGLR